jgi:hypothetical protein
MPGYQTALRIFVGTFVGGIALVCVLSVAAQSGRRAKNTAPLPLPAEEPTPAKPVEKPKPALTLIVGMERNTNFGLSVTNTGSVLQALCDRLNDSPAVKVEQVGRNLSRGEAVKQAKSEKEAYVVLVELEIESRSVVNATVNDISIQYSVFSPVTAKVRAFGRTYPQAVRNKGVILSPGGGGIFGDYKLQQAARQAAEKILDAFHLQIPDSRGLDRSNRLFRFGVEPVNYFLVLFINHTPLHFQRWS